jgi:lipopolysaccharide/colanic/teichoic acid biosynthesis glycosyltransferase
MLAKESHTIEAVTVTSPVIASPQETHGALVPSAATPSGSLPLAGPTVARLTWSSERLDAAAKRVLDVAVSLVLLCLLAPAILLVAVLVRLDSPGPAFFAVRRIGHGGRELRMFKFRKMHDDAAGIPLTTDDDTRLTRIGAFLAKSKLDEIPQLWHVLRGDMSLVGPRPETIGFVARHHDEYQEILSVRPGLFGFSQIAFVSEGRILDSDDPLSHYVSAILPQKVTLDLMYARRRTLAVDVKIVTWSLVAVLLRRQVAVNRETGRMNLRKR